MSYQDPNFAMDISSINPNDLFLLQSIEDFLKEADEACNGTEDLLIQPKNSAPNPVEDTPPQESHETNTNVTPVEANKVTPTLIDSPKVSEKGHPSDNVTPVISSSSFDLDPLMPAVPETAANSAYDQAYEAMHIEWSPELSPAAIFGLKEKIQKLIDDELAHVRKVPFTLEPPIVPFIDYPEPTEGCSRVLERATYEEININVDHNDEEVPSIENILVVATAKPKKTRRAQVEPEFVPFGDEEEDLTKASPDEKQEQVPVEAESVKDEPVPEKKPEPEDEPMPDAETAPEEEPLPQTQTEPKSIANTSHDRSSNDNFQYPSYLTSDIVPLVAQGDVPGLISNENTNLSSIFEEWLDLPDSFPDFEEIPMNELLAQVEEALEENRVELSTRAVTLEDPRSIQPEIPIEVPVPLEEPVEVIPNVPVEVPVEIPRAVARLSIIPPQFARPQASGPAEFPVSPVEDGTVLLPISPEIFDPDHKEDYYLVRGSSEVDVSVDFENVVNCLDLTINYQGYTGRIENVTRMDPNLINTYFNPDLEMKPDAAENYEPVISTDCSCLHARVKYTRNIDPIKKSITNVRYRTSALFSLNNPYEPQYYRFEVKNGKLVMSTKSALCAYCPEVRFHPLKNSSYLSHLTLEHGIFSSDYMTPEGVNYGKYTVCTKKKERKVINGMLCAYCGELIQVGCWRNKKNKLLSYFRHFKNEHSAIAENPTLCNQKPDIKPNSRTLKVLEYLPLGLSFARCHTKVKNYRVSKLW